MTDKRALLGGLQYRFLEVLLFALAVVMGVRVTARGHLWGWNGGDNGIAWFCMAFFFASNFAGAVIRARRRK
jgi:hypothetical protein